MARENPISRIESSLTDQLVVEARAELPDDTRLAFEENIPPEELQYWSLVEESLAEGNMVLHELRDKGSHELLSARLMVYYDARHDNEPAFILAAWSVTPDAPPHGQDSLRGKGKGFGSYLLHRSVAYILENHPEVFAIVSERESAISTNQTVQRAQRARWHQVNGFCSVQDFPYEIPAFTPYECSEKYMAVYERPSVPVPGELLILRMDGQKILPGSILISIVERIYHWGYDIKYTDPYMSQRMSLIEPARTYLLKD
ncbi:MAG TPA: hypothetical protein V6C81_18320 [Planktothrix sp.]